MERGPTPIPLNSEFNGGSAEQARRIILKLERNGLGAMGHMQRNETVFFSMLQRATEIIKERPKGLIRNVVGDFSESVRQVEVRGTRQGNDGMICISSNSREKSINIFYNEHLPNVFLILAEPDNTSDEVYYYKVAKGGAKKSFPIGENTNQQVEELLQDIMKLEGFCPQNPNPTE